MTAFELLQFSGSKNGLNNKPYSVIHTNVRLFKTILAVLLALAWVPLTAHCQIASINGWELLKCQAGTETPAPDGSRCDDSSCCAWEPLLRCSKVVGLCAFS